MNKLSWLALVFLSVLLQACTSSGPATKYYALLPQASVELLDFEQANFSLGVGPVKIPEFLEHPGIVSLGEGNRIHVSGYNAWAGDLKTNISRVVASNLSKTLEHQEIYAFPWDARNRPHYQLRLEFENLSGVRGGEVQTRVRWMLLDREGRTVIKQATLEIAIQSGSDSYNDYVAALNAGINVLSLQIAEYLSTEFLMPIDRQALR